jgi:hypothetical protein
VGGDGVTGLRKAELEMNSNDRCDRAECGAQALVRADFATGSLFFCGHHWREVADTASQAALFVVDESTAPAETSVLIVA